MAFKDKFTSFRKVYFLRHKFEVFGKYKEFKASIFKQTGNRVKVLHSDNGTEYTCSAFSKHVKENGIVHEFSSPYIHEQNGRAEREIRTLVESARSMLISSGIEKKLWT